MKRSTLIMILFSTSAQSLTSHAAILFGLTASNSLISFDSSNPGNVTAIGTISTPGIVDIDFYPVNGNLYGLNGNGEVFRLNTTTAVATLVASPLTNIATVTDFDFNPAVDRLRIFSSNSRNFRMVPDVENSNPGTPGTVLTDGQFSDLEAELVGAAYSNNFDGVAAATTSLYSIDTTTNSLLVHSGGPSFNTLNSVGTLGVVVGSNVGFDILNLNTAFLSDDNSLYQVDLTTGRTASLGTVGGTGLTSIAASSVPESGGLAVLLPAIGLLAFCRRNSAPAAKA